jgi:hypothetical protein
MSVVEGPRSAGLIARAQAILTRPMAEWDVIDGEAATIPGLFTGYACILAAIPPIATLIKASVFHPFGLGHIGLLPAVFFAIITYVVSLVGVYIVGFIIDALAPSFDAQKNQVQAMKLAVYSYTASWVGGVFNLIPFLGGLLVLAAVLYGLYIFWLGVPKLMKSPQEKTAGYAIVTIIVAIVVNAIIFGVIAAVGASMLVGAAITGAAFH